MTNPNTNCLEGMRCPDCGSYGPFEIAATITVEVSDEGTEDLSGGYGWSAASFCRCNYCDHTGTVDTFTEPTP